MTKEQEIELENARFFAKHPELISAIEMDPNCIKYTQYGLDKDNKHILTKQLEKREDGKWLDVTARELAKLELEKALKDYAKLGVRNGNC